jgi:hypothetical protein
VKRTNQPAETKMGSQNGIIKSRDANDSHEHALPNEAKEQNPVPMQETEKKT